MSNVTRVATLVLVFVGGCAALGGTGGDSEFPTGSGSTLSRSVPTGAKCVGLSNGVGERHARLCESCHCEMGMCVKRCTGPETGGWRSDRDV